MTTHVRSAIGDQLICEINAQHEEVVVINDYWDPDVDASMRAPDLVKVSLVGVGGKWSASTLLDGLCRIVEGCHHSHHIVINPTRDDIISLGLHKVDGIETIVLHIENEKKTKSDSFMS